MSNAAAARRQKAQEEIQRRMQEKFAQHVREFPMNIEFPARVSSATDNKPLRTDPEIVLHRLLESGVSFEDLQQVQHVTEAATDFVTNMTKSGCYHTVQVKLGASDAAHPASTPLEGLEEAQPQMVEPKETLEVILNERNWYRLYIGGGLKHEGLQQHASDSLVPKVQFETSVGLINLTGHLDNTSLQYTVDQASSTTLAFHHERPLYTYFPENGALYMSILQMQRGSQMSLAFRAMLDTLDYEWTRSYKEYQRLLSVRLSNVSNAPHAEMAEGGYAGLDWSMNFRDVIPRRHSTLPYAVDASPEVVSQSQPSLKHSLCYEYRTNGRLTDDRFQPTDGLDFHAKMELAGPPGDVGFIKAQGGLSYHAPIPSSGVALHGSFQAGLLQPLAFGGLCGPPTLSDRFYVGGPMQLRGFVPAGIGPRAKAGGSSTPRGDALGGDLFYTAALAASIPFPAILFLQEHGVRLFGFANVGTLTSLSSVPLLSILKSTRASVGGGVSFGTAFGRLEATYAVPLRYGPRDARRSVQFGLGFTVG